jgi:hypothetical protein
MKNLGFYYNFKINQIYTFKKCAKVEFEWDGILYTGNGRVELDLAASGKLLIHAVFDGIDGFKGLKLLSELDSIQEIFLEGNILPVLLQGQSQREIDDLVELTFLPNPNKIDLFNKQDSDSQSVAIVTHLFNFIKFRGGTIMPVELPTGGEVVLNTVIFETKELIYKIIELPDLDEKLVQIKNKQEYALTHVLNINKKTHERFSDAEIKEIMWAVKNFLSFVNGSWITPSNLLGFDSSGNVLWSKLTSPQHLSPRRWRWFDDFHAGQLSELFPKFQDKWNSGSWNAALGSAISWYLQANNNLNPVEVGIVLTQAGLEQLSYEYAVNNRKLLTKNGFKDLWASDKFRLLFSSLEIPLAITNETPNMLSVSAQNGFKWLDAPHALTEICNSIVHPEHSKKGQIDHLFYEAWHLGLRYLEFSILAICGYRGTYSNRLRKNGWVGQVDQVPWAK